MHRGFIRTVKFPCVGMGYRELPPSRPQAVNIEEISRRRYPARETGLFLELKAERT